MPANPNLIKALEQASSGDQEAEQRVYEELLKSEVIVPIDAPPEDKGNQVDAGFVTIAVRGGKRGLPVFTHTQAVKAWNADWQWVLAFPAKDVFKMALGMNLETIIIDPAGPNWAELKKTTIEMLSQGHVPALTDSAVSASGELFNKGVALAEPYLFFANGKRQDPNSDQGQRDLQEAISFLESAIKILPEHWAAHWFLGKIFQSQQNHQISYDHLKTAYQLKPDHIDVCREYGQACLEFGRPDEAVAVGRRSAQLWSDNAGMIANLALALLFNGKLTEAKQTAERAYSMEPNDRVTKNLITIISDVQSGKRKQPKTISDLQKQRNR